MQQLEFLLEPGKMTTLAYLNKEPHIAAKAEM